MLNKKCIGTYRIIFGSLEYRKPVAECGRNVITPVYAGNIIIIYVNVVIIISIYMYDKRYKCGPIIR